MISGAKKAICLLGCTRWFRKPSALLENKFRTNCVLDNELGKSTLTDAISRRSFLRSLCAGASTLAHPFHDASVGRAMNQQATAGPTVSEESKKAASRAKR